MEMISSEFSPALKQFLAERFGSEEDLPKSPYVELQLRSRCTDLEAALTDLGRRLSQSIVSYTSRSDEAGELFTGINEGLIDLQSSTLHPNHELSSNLRDGEDLKERDDVLAEDLPALAKEVARVETIRIYAETALKLDGLIGDVEDAVSSSYTGKLKSSNSVNPQGNKNIQKVINFLKEIESILSQIKKTRPQWARLISAVDHRVDRALAVLRPQSISDHRSLLSSLGWPPPITNSNTYTNSAQFSNPLFSLMGDLKLKYSESFLSLCNLQELQRRRKSRQLDGQSGNFETLIRQPLWVIEELVNPLSLSAQKFFPNWVDKPEFIFALVFKIIRDFIDSMDDILQPLVDKANLLGYACREEWIAGLVTSLITYLSKEIFPKYIDLLQDENNSNTDVSNNARVSWLNLVDLMGFFDKRTQTLIRDTGLFMSLKEDENLRRFLSLSVFCDRPDWLDIWAEIEKNEMLNKIKPVLQNEKNWNILGSDETKSPVVSGVAIQNISLLIDRVRPLPSIELRSRFITLTCGPVISEFIDFLVFRCQQAEGLTALTEDNAVLEVVQSINSARYFEYSLIEWSEDLFFLELETNGKCIFEEGINRIHEFIAEWVEKISKVILRGFHARTRDYVKNKRQWQERIEGFVVSRNFIDSLDFIQGKICKLEEAINSVDFVIIWSGVAKEIDQLIFNGVLLGGVKFDSLGVERLYFDLGVLFGVFKAWCLRPEGFFSKLNEGIRVLKMDELEIKNGFLREGEKWMKEKGVRYMNLSEVEKLVKNRSFDGR